MAATIGATSLRDGSSVSQLPGISTVLRAPLHARPWTTRALLRGLAVLARRQVVSITGLEHIRTANDPFVLVLNHSTRTEALLVPALLVFHRGGRLIHFLADWNFRLIPGIGLIYRRAEAVSVMRKPARPRFLNVLKPLYRPHLTAFEQARRHLIDGYSVGLFPEGTVNRDSRHLLDGRRGAARLSLETGVPVIPVGIRFPDVPAGHRIGDGAAMAVTIGAPLSPPVLTREWGRRAPLADVLAWHAAIMTEVGRLCGKTWCGKTWSHHQVLVPPSPFHPPSRGSGR